MIIWGWKSEIEGNERILNKKCTLNNLVSRLADQRLNFEHRCTRVENPREGVPDVFAKIPRRGQGFQEKLPWRSPYFGFYCIFINKCFEICLRGVLYLPSPPPYVHLWLWIRFWKINLINHHFKNMSFSLWGICLPEIFCFPIPFSWPLPPPGWERCMNPPRRASWTFRF